MLDMTMLIEQIDISYTTDFFSVSRYPLSGATAIARVMGAFEDVWDLR